MSLKDAPAHRNGKRHQLALNKVDANPQPMPFSASLPPTADYGEDGQADGQGRDEVEANSAVSNAMASNLSLLPVMANPSGSSDSRGALASTSSINAAKQEVKAQKRSKKAKQPKRTKENNSPAHAGSGNLQSTDYRAGYFIDNFPNALHNHSQTSYSICGKECGSRGQCMDHLSTNFAAFNPFPANFDSTSTTASISTEVRDPLKAFFALYAPFKYNRFASSHGEFKRLCVYFDWPPHYVEPEHPEREEAWQGFRIAMVKAFNATFGDNEYDLEAWGRMCVLVGMKSIPKDLEARKLAMINTHVNLCDLLDTTRQGTEVHIFASEAELREYTKRTGKIFPREEAYAGGLLKYLLREISGTYQGNRGRRVGFSQKNGKHDGKKVKYSGKREPVHRE